MTRLQSGGLLIGVGLVLNILGRLLGAATRSGSNVAIAGLLAALMVASLVLMLFGLYRVLTGLRTR